MSLSNAAETALLALIFNATTYGDIAENDTTGPLTNLYVSLHTADPGEAGTQPTNEAAYTSYARVAVARTSGGWAISGNIVNPVANIDFPAATGGSETLTHFAIGHLASGAGAIICSGTIDPDIVVSAGVIPRLTTATAITLD